MQTENTTEELKKDLLPHDGKKPHSCNQCGYTSNKASHLKTHMLVHSGEKPFVCKQRASPHCEPACGFSDQKPCCLRSRTGCNCGASSHDAESCAFWGLSSFWRRYCIEHTVWFWPFPLLNLQLLLFNQTRKRVGGELKMAETKFKVEWFLKSESNIIALSYLQLHGLKVMMMVVSISHPWS